MLDLEETGEKNPNQNKKLKSFKSKENIHKNEDGPDCTVSNNKFLSVTENC